MNFFNDNSVDTGYLQCAIKRNKITGRQQLTSYSEHISGYKDYIARVTTFDENYVHTQIWKKKIINEPIKQIMLVELTKDIFPNRGNITCKHWHSVK